MDWRVFAATFAALFVAELGDKTQLAVITLTSKHQNPWSVFLGATAALGRGDAHRGGLRPGAHRGHP